MHPQSFNRYTYAYGDPINSVDPGGSLAVCADDFISSGAGGGAYPCYDPFGHIQVGISLHTVAEYDKMYGDPHCGGRGYSFLPNGHPYCAPDEGGGQASPAKPCTDWGCMPPAYARAVQALTLNKNCFDLFGNDKTRQGAWNPVTVLTSLAVTRNFAHGSINFDYTGTAAARTTPTGVILPSISNGITGSGANISINASIWNINNVDYNAETLLHELGHLYNFTRGSGSFAVKNPAEIKDNEAFDKVIKQNCGL